MTSFLSRLFSIFTTQENKPKDTSITANVLDVEITVNSTDVHSSKKDFADLRNKRAREYRRYDRLMRHKKIWAILSYVKSINAVYNSNDFYDLDKALLDYGAALAQFENSDFRPSENEILCAFRFCDAQNYKGKCEHRLTETEKLRISNWSIYTLDFTNILKVVSKRFVEHWDDVLETYKRKSDYSKRLECLLGHLSEVKHRESLSAIPQIDEYINEIRIHYLNLKSNSLNDSDPTSKKAIEP